LTEPSDRTVNNRIAGADHHAAHERGVGAGVQLHRAPEFSGQRLLQGLELRRVERERGHHVHLDTAFGLGAALLELRHDLGQ